MSRSLGGTSLTTRSPMRSVPALISSRPAIIRRLVVLPQPDGPTRTMNSPSPISRLRSFTAWKSPYIFWTFSNVTVAMAQPPRPAILREPMHPAAEADVDGLRTRTARGHRIVGRGLPGRKVPERGEGRASTPGPRLTLGGGYVAVAPAADRIWRAFAGSPVTNATVTRSPSI